jgi:hypothetical protein
MTQNYINFQLNLGKNKVVIVVTPLNVAQTVVKNLLITN